MENISNIYSPSTNVISINRNLSPFITLIKLDDLQNDIDHHQPSVLLIDMQVFNDNLKILKNISIQNPLIKIIKINEDNDINQNFDSLSFGIENIPTHVFSGLELNEFMGWVFHDAYRVLIIDDNTVDGLYYEKLLDKIGFKIKTIQSNVEIIEPIKFYQPDLLLAFIDINEIAGDELVKLIKQIPENLSLPIFFITSESPNNLKQKILDVGACQIFTKPTNKKLIVSKIIQKIQSNQFDFIDTLPKVSGNNKSIIPVADNDHDQIISFITDNSKNKSASVIWLKINNKAALQKKIGISGFNKFCELFIKNLPVKNLNFSSVHSITEGIFAFTNKNLAREQADNWIKELQMWTANTTFTSRENNFNAIIKPFVLTNIPNKSNKELLFYDTERLLLNSGTNHNTIYVSEGDDQKHFYLIKTKLENAIREKSFNWLYQSILNTKNNDMEIFQLLLRVISKNGKELKTKDYLKVANQTGLLKLLDRFTLEHAVEMIKTGENKNIDRHILINQLIDDYASESYKTEIIKYIKSQNLPKNRLVFQFRQDMVEEHTNLLNELGNELRQSNITICLSEFDSTKNAWDIAKALKTHWIRVKPFELKSNSLLRNNPEYIGNVIKKAQNLGYKLMIPNIDSAGLTADIWTLNADLIQGNFIQAPVADLKYIEG